MQNSKLFLNKIIEEGDYAALARYNITIDDMHNDIDRNTYRFIEKYAQENGGKAPSYAVVADNVEGYEYIPGVSDSYSYLARQIKDYSAQQGIVDLFRTGEFERKLNELGGQEFVNKWLPTVLESVKMRTTVRETIGTDIKRDSDKFIEEYERRKAGESFKVWKSKYSAIGEYISGNMYTVFGESGRGKSVITLEDAIYAASQGANVLLWTLEMGWYEVMVRIYTSISGDQGYTRVAYEGVDMDAGFNARDLRLGELSEEFEEAFKTFIRNINAYIPGNITVRAVDDEEFTDRSLRALEADIKQVGADFVVIDPFYYLQFEKNTSRTTGGDASNTSMKLRAMTGRLSIVTVAITQSDVKKSEESEEGSRELRLPEREDVKKTKSLLEDAAVLIGIDSDYKQGLAIVGNMKGRDGGEGDISNVLYLPQFGVVKELETGEEALAGFNF
mgnify:FL=1